MERERQQNDSLANGQAGLLAVPGGLLLADVRLRRHLAGVLARRSACCAFRSPFRRCSSGDGERASAEWQSRGCLLSGCEYHERHGLNSAGLGHAQQGPLRVRGVLLTPAARSAATCLLRPAQSRITSPDRTLGRFIASEKA